MSWFAFIHLILRVLTPFRALLNELQQANDLNFLVSFLPNIFLSFVETVDECLWWFPHQIANCKVMKQAIVSSNMCQKKSNILVSIQIHPTFRIRGQCPFKQYVMMILETDGCWWVRGKGDVRQQQNSSVRVGWNIVPSTTTINIREGVLKFWHDGVRYKNRSQPGTKMIRLVCCGGSNP